MIFLNFPVGGAVTLQLESSIWRFSPLPTPLQQVLYLYGDGEKSKGYWNDFILKKISGRGQSDPSG